MATEDPASAKAGRQISKNNENEEETIMSIRTKVAILAVLALLVVGVIVARPPVFACAEGCTPGFWKQEQHFQYWPVPQDSLVTDYYDVACLADEIGSDTLLDALNYQGGKGLEGKAQILLRAAVASLLNGMTMDHQPPQTNIQHVNGAIAHACETGNTGLMEYWAEDFDAKNNQGCVSGPDICPCQ